MVLGIHVVDILDGDGEHALLEVLDLAIEDALKLHFKNARIADFVAAKIVEQREQLSLGIHILTGGVVPGAVRIRAIALPRPDHLVTDDVSGNAGRHPPAGCAHRPAGRSARGCPSADCPDDSAWRGDGTAARTRIQQWHNSRPASILRRTLPEQRPKRLGTPYMDHAVARCARVAAQFDQPPRSFFSFASRISEASP